VVDWKSLPANLKTIRHFRGLSQADFAKEIGIAKSTLQRAERGEVISMSTIYQIAGQLKVPLATLLADPEELETDLLAISFLRDEVSLIYMPQERRSKFLRSVKKYVEALEECWKEEE